MHISLIGIGSNLGNREANCRRAVDLLKVYHITKNPIISRWYETEMVIPAGIDIDISNYPSFINGVIKIETDLMPERLLTSLQKIELEMGRIRTGKKWEPRVIDLDILFYDDMVIDSKNLKIPHPELHKRIFVLRPLCDIAPDWKHPLFKKSAKQLLEEL